jgi:hypothetical protein
MKKSFGFAAQQGYSLGSIIAVSVSWSLNHSIFWAILHGLVGWLYVIYYLIFK